MEGSGSAYGRRGTLCLIHINSFKLRHQDSWGPNCCVYISSCCLHTTLSHTPHTLTHSTASYVHKLLLPFSFPHRTISYFYKKNILYTYVCFPQTGSRIQLNCQIILSRFFFKIISSVYPEKKRKTQKKIHKKEEKKLKRCRYAKWYRLLFLFLFDGSKTQYSYILGKCVFFFYY